MSRTKSHGQRRSKRLTNSTLKVLGGGWHLHHSERLGERISKRHAKRNESRRNRVAGQQETRTQTEEV